jgi:hypothetical protein
MRDELKTGEAVSPKELRIADHQERLDRPAESFRFKE